MGHLVLQLIRKWLQPGTDGFGCVGGSTLCLTVIRRFLADSSFRGSHFLYFRLFLGVKSSFVAMPGVRERGWAGQESFSENFDCK